MNASADKYHWYSFVLILSVTLFNTLYNNYFPLHVDEAYYWMMSKHPSSGYFDIPPMLPWMIGLFGILGDAEWIIRLVSTISFAISAIYLFKISALIYNSRTGLWVVAAFLALPVTHLGSTITTTDSPHILFWTMASYYSYLAIKNERTIDFIITGMLCGLALLSKYTAVLLPAAFFLFILWKRPQLLRSYKPWLGALVLLIVFSPNIYWNYQHQWEAFIFRYQYGTGSSSTISYKSIGEYIGGSILLLTPVFFYVYIRYFSQIWSKLELPGQWLLFLSLVVFSFFGYKSIYKEMALNWYAPAAILGLIFVAGMLERQNRKFTYLTGLAVALTITTLVKFPDQLNMPPHSTIKNRVVGYEEAVKEFSKLLPSKNALVCGDYYSTASIVAYYQPYTRESILEPFTTTRKSDFDYWEQQSAKNGLEGRSCYLFMDYKISSAIRSQCREVTELGNFVFNDPRYAQKYFYYYYCDNSVLETLPE
jgi:hypothetical protein